MPRILLIDNGSSRAASTLSLRNLAAALTERLGRPVDPVSLQHSDKVPARELQGRPAETLGSFLRRALSQGERDFLALPLFFGPSRALSHFIPETAAAMEPEFGPLRLRVAPELCPLPAGEPRLAAILADHVEATAASAGILPRRVVLVDHGSPSPRVTAVRHWLAGRVQRRLGAGASVGEAVMERRPGPDYDFNGELLGRVLDELGKQGAAPPVILAMLFLAPGRHAGPGGDIAGIIAGAERSHPGLRVHPTPLVGAHPALLDILAERAAALAS